MIINRTFLLGQGNARSLRVVSIPAYRGMIIDRNGQPLAVSTPVDSVWLDPSEFNSKAPKLTELAELLKMPKQKILEQLAHTHSKEFMYLRRGINPFYANKIRDLNIPGLYVQREFRRFYPEGEVTAQLIGFTNVDDQGQEGEELAYNQWLQGIPGKKRIIKDRLGHIVADVELIQGPQPGHTLTLSIDRRIQFLAYRELKQAIQNFQAQSGSVVVLDSLTGEILALVNQPSFNPNNRPIHTNNGRTRNRAVTDVFEPGSTIKPFSVANALASGKFKPTTMIDTRPGWMKVETKIVRDIHDYGVLDVTGILRKSSNIGVTKMTLALPSDQLWQLLSNAGFGRVTDASFPGESPGLMLKPDVWRPFRLATLSFGYGLNATALQLAQAYSIFANEGRRPSLSLLKTNQPRKGETVIHPKLAKQMLEMLESVVSQGSATRAQVPGYRVCGKTGTVRNIGPNGYDKDHHTSLFAGIAPVSHPRLVVAVVVKDPQNGKYYGGEVAAPVFSKVMGGALRILNVAPDKPLDIPTQSNPTDKSLLDESEFEKELEQEQNEYVTQ